MRKVVLLSLFFCASFLSAQSPVPAIGVDPITVSSRQMEILNRAVHEHSMEEARRAAVARDEQFARMQFREKANHFVAIWEDFVDRLNEKQTFDAKLAKKLAKAFRELENSEGWPVREQTASTSHEK